MKFQRQPVEEVNVNLTPLIDVVFLLLIFFMVSTTFNKERELALELPQATAQPAAEDSKAIQIEINAGGDYAINGKVLVNRDSATLKRALEQVSEGDTELPLIITADASTPHQAVITVMDICGQMGFVRLRLTTQQLTQ